MKILLRALLYLFLSVNVVYSQCGPGVPVFTVNLAGNPSGTWISPNVVRNDVCCGVSNPNVCVEFLITLDSNAVGVNFSIASGAVPGGALFYQINCGPPTAVGQPICLSGPGPHVLTFCKPGGNSNTFQIASIPAPVGGNDITINQGCKGVLSATGFSATTVSWTSIYPGAPGAYNSYLSCATSCTTTTVTGTASSPPYVDYKICGTPSAPCFQSTTICDTVRVYFNPTLFANIIPSNPVVCYGQTTASLTVVGSGGTPAYSYLWSTGATSQNVTVGSGPYSVLLSDASGCPPVSANVTVTSFTVPITAHAGPDLIVCKQTPAASLSGTVTGASGGVWSGGSGTFTPSNTTLSNVSYSPTATEVQNGFVNLILTTTGNGGCPGTNDTMKITYQPFTGAVSITNTNVSCYGGTNGTASASVTGGPSPYSYSWSTIPSQTTASAGNLGMGTYSVTVKDGIGCISTSTIAITQPLPLNLSSTITNVSCSGGSDGAITVAPVGGTPPYTYSWGAQPGSGPSLSNLPAGNYTAKIVDANGCVLSQPFSVTQPAPISLTLTPSQVSCFNGNNGSIQVTATGGTGSYAYTWTPAGGNASTAAGLAAGTYTVQVKDVNNCLASSSSSVTQPPLLQVAVSTTNEACDYLNNGMAQASASGGTPAYSYSWQPGNLSGSNVSGLSSGLYTLTVNDLNGCSTSTIFTISQPPPLVLSVVNSSSISCFGGNNGSIASNATGGTPGYFYSWQPISNSSNSAVGLSSGSYTITVTDQKGCTAQLVKALLQPVAPLSASAASASVACYGGSNGSLNSNATGGTSPYNYYWSPLGISGQNIANVGAGNYSVLITDANGCTSTATTVVIQPAAIGMTFSVTNSTCGNANGAASVIATGGAPSYTYQWAPIGGNSSSASSLPAGSYNVTITDMNGCVVNGGAIVNDNAGPNATLLSTTNVSCFGGNNGSATVGTSGGTGPFTYSWQPYGGNSPTATGLAAGTYTVTVTDSNGCQSLATTSPAITQPPVIQINTSKTNVSCFGGSNGQALATVTGGNPGYTYTWSPVSSSTNSVAGLPTGTYTVQVSDANGCIQSQSVTVNQPAAPLSVSIASVSNVSCYGGSNGTATSGVTGGTAPYSYNWTSGSSASNAVGLSAGSYTVTVTDSKGCSAQSAITITQPTQSLAVTATSTPVSCFGGSDGSVTANPVGGTPGYFYSWSPNPGTTQTVNNVTAGVKLVTVTDNNGCVAYSFVSVSQPAALTATIASTNASCGNSNGSLSVNVSGGNFPYTYSWTPTNSTSPAINGLAPGTYSVAVTDSKGCNATYTGSLINVPGPSLAVTSTSNTSCYGGNNGIAIVNASGGTAPYSYNWQPYGGNGAAASGLVAGNYTCTVFDSRNCISTVTLAISQPPPVNITLINQAQPSCYGGQNGVITTSVSGGTPGYNYTWSPIGGNNAVSAGIPAGTYTLSVSDSKGCSSALVVPLSQPAVLQPYIVSATNPTCFNGSNGSVNAWASGGSLPYQFAWQTSPVQNGTQATGLAQGTYTVMVTDNNSCVASVTVSLIQPSQVVTSGGTGDTICLGQSATISASANGGSGNYFYYWTPQTTGNNAASQVVSPNTTTNYTVTAYDQSGCAGSSSVIHVEVYSLVAGNVEAYANSPICPGNGTLVYAMVTGNPGPVTYSWNNNLGSGPGGFWVVPSQPTSYIVTVTNTCGTTVKDTITVNFNPPPTISISPDVISGCVPLLVKFTDSSLSGNPNDPISGWSWSFGDGSSSTAQNPVHTYTTSGSYSVTLTVVTGHGCTNNNASAPINITVHTVPEASFYVNSTQLTIPFDHLSCTNQSSGASAYSWTFGDGGSSVLANPNYLYTLNGTFKVELIATNQYGCKDTADIYVTTNSDIIVPTGFTPNSNAPSGGYYDNSSLDNDIFFPYTSGVVDYHLTIFNRWGELIFETFEVKQGWDGYYRGKLCQLGVYVWKIDLKWNNGKTFNKVGDVTLLR